MSFAKNMGKNFSSKYGQKLLDSANKIIAYATKNASYIEIQKSAEATDDLIADETADKITSVSKHLLKNYIQQSTLNNPKIIKRK